MSDESEDLKCKHYIGVYDFILYAKSKIMVNVSTCM